MRGILFTSVAVAALAPAVHADVLLGSFENSSMAGSLEGNWSVSAGTSTFSSTGASEGTSSLAVTPATGFNWSIALNGNTVLRDAILANDKIAFDVTIASGPQTPDVWEYAVFSASFNSDVPGWQQTSTNLTRADGGGDNAWNANKATFVWDYAPTVMSASATWSQFNIGTNVGNLGSNPAPVIHIDNVRLISAVPEPTAIGLLAGVGAMALRRRRPA